MKTFIFKLVIEVEAEDEEKATEIALQSFKDGLGELVVTADWSENDPGIEKRMVK
jgi:hypothetical protein